MSFTFASPGDVSLILYLFFKFYYVIAHRNDSEKSYTFFTRLIILSLGPKETGCPSVCYRLFALTMNMNGRSNRPVIGSNEMSCADVLFVAIPDNF